MKTLLRSLSSISAIAQGSDMRVISDTLHAYEKIPKVKRNLVLLRRELKKKYPFFFQRRPRHGAKELRLQCVPTRVSSHTTMLSSFTKDRMKTFVKTHRGDIMRLREEVRKAFPIKSYKHAFRVKDYGSFLEASRKYRDRRSMMDIVGMRIVPKKALFFPDAIRRMEDVFRGRIDFRLNTFAYTDLEIKKVLGRYSLYHHAIHYYFSLGDFYIEIQMKTPAIDQWSMLHHDTLYKRKVMITAQEKRAIMAFGRISNIVDYHRMLEG